MASGTAGEALPAARGRRGQRERRALRRRQLRSRRRSPRSSSSARSASSACARCAGAPPLIANVPRQAGRRRRHHAGRAGDRGPAARGHARPRLTRPMATAAAALPASGATAGEAARALARPARAGPAARSAAAPSRCSCSRPLATILVKSVQDKDGAFVGLLQFREYFGTPRAPAVDLEHALGGADRDGDHRPARLHVRLCADALVHARQGHCSASSR